MADIVMAIHRLWSGTVIILASMALVALDSGGWMPLGTAIFGFVLVVTSFSTEEAA